MHSAQSKKGRKEIRKAQLPCAVKHNKFHDRSRDRDRRMGADIVKRVVAVCGGGGELRCPLYHLEIYLRYTSVLWLSFVVKLDMAVIASR